jgi:alanyl aminopeptidase
MRRVRSLWCLAIALASSCGTPAHEQVATTPPSPTPAPAPAPPPLTREAPPLGPLPRDARPLRERLELTIDPAASRFGGTAELDLELTRPRDQLWLHGRGLAVHAVVATTADGRTVPARWEEADPIGVARVTLGARLTGKLTLRITYDAAYDPSLVGVYRTGAKGGEAVFSKFEAIYARRAFPCFDEPSFKIPYDVALTVPAAAVAIGNMPVARTEPAGAQRRVTFQTTPALPSYLVAFAVGPFDVASTVLAPQPPRTAPLPIGAVALAGRGRDTAFALAQEPKLLAWQERYFDVAFPYPKLDLIAVPDFQSGAMENAGAITFRDSVLLVDDKVTPLRTRRAVAAVIAHETAHQWFGDYVTMAWWDDLWLNEGFATFLTARTLRAVRPEDEAELEVADALEEVMTVDGLASARQIRQPIASSHDITNAFDGITYKKGAAVLAMVEHYIGEAPFRQGLHDHLVKHALGNATTADLVGALSAAAGKDLAPMVGSFLDHPGVPVVTAQAKCEAGRGSVELRQDRWRAIGADTRDARWTIPVCVRAGIAGKVERVCTVLDQPTGAVALPGCTDWILANADAAGYYRSYLPGPELARLRDRGGLAKLSTLERVTLGHDLEAAFASGALATGDLLRALAPLARDRHGAVAVIPLEVLQELDERFARDATRKALRAQVARLYQPAVAELGWRPAANEPDQRRLFRARVLGLLALAFDDKRVLDEASRHGLRMLGLGPDHKRHPDEVAPDLADVALAAAARTGGPRAIDALIAELEASDDAQLRGRMLGALGHVRDAAGVSRVLALGLAPQLRQSERLVVFKQLAGRAETREAAWAWLADHYDALLPLLPDRFGGQIPGMLRVCDDAWIERLDAFFAPKIDQLTGGPRNLAQAKELGAQCAARVKAQQAGFDQALRP